MVVGGWGVNTYIAVYTQDLKFCYLPTVGVKCHRRDVRGFGGFDEVFVGGGGGMGRSYLFSSLMFSPPPPTPRKES